MKKTVKKVILEMAGACSNNVGFIQPPFLLQNRGGVGGGERGGGCGGGSFQI